MKQLLNTLYLTNPDYYLALDGENIVIKLEKEVGRVPLHNLEAVVAFGFRGASPALMGKCAEKNIALSFLAPSGKFQARVTGKTYGNILLRKEQYRIADSEEKSCIIARNFISGKIYNSRSVLRRAIRDYHMRIDTAKLEKAAEKLKESGKNALNADNRDTLRGMEGEAAAAYFSVFDSMILQQKDIFCFEGRVKRPPADYVNALLSFAYTLLTGMCISALETVGLDPYAGFMHTDRPGRCSLALDLMEELRAPFADRFVLSLINKKMVNEKDFQVKENGAVLLNDNARKQVIEAWQNRKEEKITHPFLQEKVEWGMIPYVQALLLARYIRKDLDAYPAFLWK